MKDIFSVEEINLMCIYNTSDKSTLITELQDNLPGICDPDMQDIYKSTIAKLEKISDEDFSDIGLYIADEYFDEMEV